MSIEHVEPADCSLWQFHQRFGEDLSEDSCKELIASMQRHGQRHAVLGRRLEQKSGAAIELIYGGRRLFAATRLGMKLLVDVRELEDRAAIVEMEIENRLRADVTPYERGLSYRHWLNSGIFASQSELARELGVSEAQVSKLLRYSELPAAVVGAFDSARSITEEWAVALARLCRDPLRRPALVRRARELARAEARHPPEWVFRRLVSEDSLRGHTTPPKRDEVVHSASGKAIYRIAVRPNTIHFILPRANLSEELLGQLRCQLNSILEPVAQIPQATRVPVRHRAGRPRLSEARSAGA